MTAPVEVLDAIADILLNAADHLNNTPRPWDVETMTGGESYESALDTVAGALRKAVKYAQDQIERGEE